MNNLHTSPLKFLQKPSPLFFHGAFDPFDPYGVDAPAYSYTRSDSDQTLYRPTLKYYSESRL